MAMAGRVIGLAVAAGVGAVTTLLTRRLLLQSEQLSSASPGRKGDGRDGEAVVLRTEAAEEALERMAREVPELIVGAGTVLSVAQAARAVAAGAAAEPRRRSRGARRHERERAAQG